MDILKIVILSLGSLIVLFILTKIMGNKEMSQLSMFDYIVSITIGSIAAEMSTSLENNFIEPLVAMIIYAIVTVFISLSNSKFLHFRRIVLGKSLILMDNGKLYRENFKKGKLDLSEFLMQCRANGYFDLNDIQTALLEANGKISFLPRAEKRPATPSDLNISPTKNDLPTNVIMDGTVLETNLQNTGNNLAWLTKELKSQGIDKIEDVFLATCDKKNNLSVYIKLKSRCKQID